MRSTKSSASAMIGWVVDTAWSWSRAGGVPERTLAVAGADGQPGGGRGRLRASAPVLASGRVPVPDPSTSQEVASVWVPGQVRVGPTRFHLRSWDDDGPLAASGDGRSVVLLLHGWPEDGGAWSAVAAPLAALGLRVVAPDLKGFGRSDAPRRGYDPATLADEAARLIRALGVRRATLVGHDWGGAVALATAHRHPGRVEALVVAATPFRDLDLGAAWHVPLLALPIVPELAFRVAGATLTRAALRYAAADPSPFDAAAVERCTDAVTRHPHGWLAYYRTLSRRVVVGRARRAIATRLPLVRTPSATAPPRVPTTVVWGTADPVTPVALASGVARDLDAELVLIEGAGHFVHEEAPEAFARAVLGTRERVAAAA